MDPKFTAQNPIVEAAERIRAKRTIEGAIGGDSADALGTFDDVEAGLRELAKSLETGRKRINAILGESTGVKLIRLETPFRLRLRFGEKRIGFDLDDVNQLVHISGMGLDGDYQFVPGASVPALINISIVSTEAGYGDALTSSKLLQTITKEAELPRPSHLEGSGPLQF